MSKIEKEDLETLPTQAQFEQVIRDAIASYKQPYSGLRTTNSQTPWEIVMEGMLTLSSIVKWPNNP